MTALADMTAVILCGGLGTRLREETEFKPKPMVAIGGRPILWHIMKHYRHYGVRKFVLCLGYRGDVIRDYFLNYPLYNSDFAIDFKNGGIETLASSVEEDWRVTLAETGEEALTGARIRKVLRYIEEDNFLVTYGDGVSDVDLDQLYAHHRKLGRLATVTAVRPSSRFGEIDIRDGIVQSFKEKPQVAEGWINGGFFVINKSAFEGIGHQDDITFEESVLEPLARREQLGVYQHRGFWQSMDTFREMQLLNQMWDGGTAPWNVWEQCRLSA